IRGRSVWPAVSAIATPCVAANGTVAAAPSSPRTIRRVRIEFSYARSIVMSPPSYRPSSHPRSESPDHAQQGAAGEKLQHPDGEAQPRPRRAERDRGGRDVDRGPGGHLERERAEALQVDRC